ncbi:MAG: hypothetical protein CVV64_16240 [Candidatus Wallbacteria bacterium HGW-Wallbacteria-1]|uniref:Uncharacterized protein n=1 Tax=Candidatus Wallbacteria bacterium HGW-Wallbacteria-1 TaxID=2013854 RepID=A0A2N1PL28_9BACT|nr:MAG: hypothetical protein CVV64_16240 [Candidatus Wallbacteria bacterium HGW-Wallbacteria-1]
MSIPIFNGNRPGNVSKDAKYVVRHAEKAPIISLSFRSDEDETWLATTNEHPDLVKMVNDVKLGIGNPPNGSFYINEYKQVIVPAVGTEEYYYAGDYTKTLIFNFEKTTLSGKPVNLDGISIKPGQEWNGPHVGIPYVLTAKVDDLYYCYSPRPNVEKKVRLSKKIGPQRAKQVAKSIIDVLGYESMSGGRIYVNEELAMFKPIADGWNMKYIYVGQVDLNEWFPKPEFEV